MPSQDATPAHPEPQPGLSRRSVLRGAASAGAAGLAIGTIGAASAATATAASAATATTATTAASTTAAAAPDHIVVHIRDARSGDIEVFAGTSQTRLRDRDLAARIAGALS